MNGDRQRQFMYLFERIGEPLYLGPRGPSSSAIIFDVPNLNATQQHASTEVRKGLSPSSRVALMSSVRAPDLTPIAQMCPRNNIFSYFIPNHKRASQDLRQILLGQDSLEKFLAMACACRDNSMINCKLWLHSFASACLLRRDMRGFQMPSLVEVIPDSFLNISTIRQAQQQSQLPAADRAIVIVDRNFTGQDTNPENRLSYFREDIGINSHHWHWHLIYPGNAPRTGAGSRNRKGELFYYMHHSMTARYDAERLCNGLRRVIPLSLDMPLAEGYFPKLTDANSGSIWGSRQEETRIQNVNRPYNTEIPSINVTLETMQDWRSRILEAIDTGMVITADGRRVPLTVETGIDVLGDLIENATISPNERFYGDFHNMGHVLIACSHDPQFHHRENIGVIGDPATAMRDPAFYRWHRYVDNLFDRYKQSLVPYSQQELVWSGIQVTNVQVVGENQNRANVLTTFWMQSDVDLARGLDFARTPATAGPIWARLTHLNHDNFQYRITASNAGRQAVQGTVRIFIAPRNDEANRRFAFGDQRGLFFELDKFTTTLNPGQNEIVRLSTASSVTIPWNQTFRDLERLPASGITAAQSICGCGWPQHLLIPRGSESGVDFDLFVMITNGAEDAVQRNNPISEAQRQGCRDSVSYCGILDELYPDRKPMGFPFDRNAVVPGTTPVTPVPTLEEFVRPYPNMRATPVRIVHQPNRIVVRPGGAEGNMNTMTPSGRPSTSQPRPGKAMSSKKPEQGGNGPPYQIPGNNGAQYQRPGNNVIQYNNQGGWRYPSPPRSPSPPPRFNRWSREESPDNF